MSLADRMREYSGRAPSWRPEAGEWIVGVFEGFHTAPSPMSGEVQVATLRVLCSSHRTPTGADRYEEFEYRVSLWFFHSVLTEEFVRQQVQLGEQVGVKYLGKKPSSDPKKPDYHLWHVEVDRPGAAPRSEGTGTAIPNQLGAADVNLQPPAATFSPAAQARQARENPLPWQPPGGMPTAPPPPRSAAPSAAPAQGTLLLTDDDIPF